MARLHAHYNANVSGPGIAYNCLDNTDVCWCDVDDKSLGGEWRFVSALEGFFFFLKKGGGCEEILVLFLPTWGKEAGRGGESCGGVSAPGVGKCKQARLDKCRVARWCPPGCGVALRFLCNLLLLVHRGMRRRRKRLAHAIR